MKRNGMAVGCLVLIGAVVQPAIGAPVPEMVPIDVRKLERGAIGSATILAPEVAYAADSNSHGQWVDGKGWSTWTYSVQVPGAQSLAFHADVDLSEAARLNLGDGEGKVVKTYRRLDTVAAGRQIWSILVPGDTVSLTLTIPTAEKAGALISIDRLFVGVRPSPLAHAAAMQTDAATDVPAMNWSCYRSSANEMAGDATVMIQEYSSNLEGNGPAYGQCTATLVNDVPQDGRLFALTAGHCGAPDYNGSTVTVYWNRVSDCSAGLQDAFNAAGPMTSGATTRAFTTTNGGDRWLMEFSGSGVPDGSNAVYAGFDATDITQMTGTGPSDVFGINHGSNLTKQYTYASATPFQSNPGQYVSYQWDIGATYPGASGSGLFEPNQRIAATASGGSSTSPPTSSYQILANSWGGDPAETSPGASSTKLWLDPDDTGTLQTNAYVPTPAPTVSISVSPDSTTMGQAYTVTWSSTNASACTGSGVWSGSEATSGTVTLGHGQANAGTYTYTLACMGSGGSATESASVVVSAGSGSSSSSGGGEASSSSGSSSNGGGGAFSPLLIFGLAMVVLEKLRRCNSGAAENPRSRYFSRGIE